MKKDYYAVLNVSRRATNDQIKKAFRSLSRIHHPDLAVDKINSEEKFKEANEAYETLSDPVKRKAYDDALSKALITDLSVTVAQVTEEYFQQFKK